MGICISKRHKTDQPDRAGHPPAQELLGMSSKRNEYKIRVKVRDVKHGGTDKPVYCAIIDKNGNRTTDFHLEKFLCNDMERGHEESFTFSNVDHIGVIVYLDVWMDGCGNDDNKWFCEYILVTHIECSESEKCSSKGVTYPFPCHRWIGPNQTYELVVYDSNLPQLEKTASRKALRMEDIATNKITYKYAREYTGAPRILDALPDCEMFSTCYKFDIVSQMVQLIAKEKNEEWCASDKWENFDDIKALFKGIFEIPTGWYQWKCDHNFGDQRLNGVNSNQLRRCDEIPPNFAVTDQMVAPFLDDQTLAEVIRQKRLFIIDYKILVGVPQMQCAPLCSPLALFYANKEGELLPVAIQLFQQPATYNPVFLPSDPEYKWALVKMFFNNADCSIHESCTHFGFTHLLCETIAIAARQSLSPAHPVYQILAPHFLFLFAINNLAVKKLISKGGWIDTEMTMGVIGMNEILKRKWKKWRMDVDGWFPNDIKLRGVDDKEILQHYYFRDDSLLLHDAILSYVTEVLTNIYDTPEKLLDDYEVQAFANILVDKKDGGGIEGVFGGGKFELLEDLIKVVTSTIFMASVSHAAVNFGQYNQYGFPPAYPAKLYGDAPTDKTPLGESDIIKYLPDKDSTLNIMVIMHLLSYRGTDALGHFEIQYLYKPKAVEAVKRFQDNLKEVGAKIAERNIGVKIPYDYLLPSEVPNAISI